MFEEELISVLTQIIDSILQFLPNITLSAIILIIGYLVGKAAGKATTAIVKMIKIDESFGKTTIGKQLLSAGYPFSRIASILVRLVIYVLTIMTALSLLQIAVLNEIGLMIAAYMPRLIGAIIIFLLGILLVDWLTDVIERLMPEEAIPRSIVAILATSFKYLLYMVLVFVAFDVAEIAPHIVASAAQAVFLVVAVSVGLTLALLVGLGLKEEAIVLVSREAELIKPGMKVEIEGVKGLVRRVSTFLVEVEDEKHEVHVIPKREFLQKGFRILKE
ncbi:MAG: hypothetical protein DRJ38_04560 [Thermoprotei archaeon]|nr:MAG: hypothetical protein DRJ38_04560 [Thermoprotei archaeon]